MRYKNYFYLKYKEFMSDWNGEKEKQQKKKQYETEIVP